MFVFFSLVIFLSILVKVFFKKFCFQKAKNGFWKRYGILEIDATAVASEKDILLGKKDISERDDYAYNYMHVTNDKFCGMVESPYPIILIKDLELMKKVFIKHIDHFIDRRPFFGAARDDSVLRKMLGNLQGEEWKGVRSSISPTFSSGKIRRMMKHINSVGLELISVLNQRAEKDGHLIIDAHSVASNYAVDVIASAIFGLQAESVRHPNSTFSTMAHRLTNMTTFQNIKFAFSLRFPKIFRFFNIDFMDMNALHFFEELLSKKLQERMKQSENSQQTNDFLQLLVEAKKSELKQQNNLNNNDNEISTHVGHSNGTSKKEEKKQFLTDQIMRGQCMSFFFAGFRTTSTFITFSMYALALHKDVQEKLRQEIASVFKKDGSLDYEDLGQLVYLDMVISEILRKFPATLRLERLCVAEFHDDESGLHIPKGCMVGIPLYALHNDPAYYKNPEKFDPEHFSTENKMLRKPYSFLPFGIGSRSCIGMRFAQIESKAALAYLVHNYFIEPTENTPSELIGKRVNYAIVPPADLKLKLIPIV